MKYILKCYCCREVKHISYNFKNQDYFDQVLLLLLAMEFRFDFKQNRKSNVISIVVDEESTYHWLIDKIENTLKRKTYEIISKPNN